MVPTLLDLCGIQTPSFVQGRSLAALLRGETDTHRSSVLVEYFDGFRQRQTTVRSEDYKYYLHENGSELLFDLKNDPMELHNAANDPGYREALNEMRLCMLRSVQNAACYGLPRTDEY